MRGGEHTKVGIGDIGYILRVTSMNVLEMRNAIFGRKVTSLDIVRENVVSARLGGS